MIQPTRLSTDAETRLYQRIAQLEARVAQLEAGQQMGVTGAVPSADQAAQLPDGTHGVTDGFFWVIVDGQVRQTAIS